MAYAVPRYARAMDGCIASAVIVGVFGLWVVWPTASVSELASRLLRAPPEGADALLRRLPTPQVIAVIRHALTDPSRGGRIGGRPDLVERWIELDPVGALPHALELAAAGNPEPAERACVRVLRDQPRHVAAREGWARLRWNAGDVEGALRLLDGGVRDEPALLMVRADIALEQGRRGDAAQLVQDVLRLAERSDHPPTRAVADQADRMRLLLLRDLEGDGATLRDLARSGKLAPNSGQNHTLVRGDGARAARGARPLVAAGGCRPGRARSPAGGGPWGGAPAAQR